METSRPKRLTIAIPTYNRAGLLEGCLAALCRQLPGHEDDVEVIVSDNCSPDGTGDVVRKYQALAPSIVYHCNEKNIGSYWNIQQCYGMGQGEYVLVLGDDDLLLDGALEVILRTLATGPYGVVYLDGYGFDDDPVREAPPVARAPRPILYEDRRSFVRRVSYYVTFVSGNVVNRSLVDPDLRMEAFVETNLGQTVKILSAILASPRNAVIEGHVVAARNNQGAAYPVCQVFGTNLDRVLSHFRSAPEGAACASAIQRALLLRFLPGLLLGIRAGKLDFQREDAFAVLSKVFRTNPWFWLFTAPVVVLPLPLARGWHLFTRATRRLSDELGKLAPRPPAIDVGPPGSRRQPA